MTTKLVLIAVVLAGMLGAPAFAQTCNQIGSSVQCDGPEGSYTGNRIGDDTTIWGGTTRVPDFDSHGGYRDEPLQKTCNRIGTSVVCN